MSEAPPKSGPTEQTDPLLWAGGAIVVGLASTWLLLSKPWADGADFSGEAAPSASETARGAASAAAGSGLDAASGDAASASRSDTAAEPIPAGAAPGTRQTPRAALESALEHDPLRMAQLAFEAGMLVEPEEFSAWTLYTRALEVDPDNANARRGLETIANELMKRASVAVDQGRFDDARATIERVQSAIPAHPSANSLVVRINTLDTEPETDLAAEALETIQEPEPVAAGSDGGETDSPVSEAAQVDPLLEPHERFVAAVTDNRLLTPADASARRFLDAMIALDPAHPLTADARARFSEELLRRANASIVALDAAAAETWLDEAERVAVNADLVHEARARLRRRLIDAESTRRVPASALVVEHYVAPRFPARALDRAFQGWVDIEFTVATDGTTRDITVTDSSNNSFFRREAVDAVEKWRFQPRVFLGETIEQRAYTRIRFTLD